MGSETHAGERGHLRQPPRPRGTRHHGAELDLPRDERSLRLLISSSLQGDLSTGASRPGFFFWVSLCVRKPARPGAAFTARGPAAACPMSLQRRRPPQSPPPTTALPSLAARLNSGRQAQGDWYLIAQPIASLIYDGASGQAKLWEKMPAANQFNRIFTADRQLVEYAPVRSRRGAVPDWNALASIVGSRAIWPACGISERNCSAQHRHLTGTVAGARPGLVAGAERLPAMLQHGRAAGRPPRAARAATACQRLELGRTKPSPLFRLDAGSGRWDTTFVQSIAPRRPLAQPHWAVVGKCGT